MLIILQRSRCYVVIALTKQYTQFDEKAKERNENKPNEGGHQEGGQCFREILARCLASQGVAFFIGSELTSLPSSIFQRRFPSAYFFM